MGDLPLKLEEAVNRGDVPQAVVVAASADGECAEVPDFRQETGRSCGRFMLTK